MHFFNFSLMTILSALSTQFIVVFFLLIISLFLSITLAVYAFKLKDNKTAFLFGLIMLLVILWSTLKISCLFIYSIQIREILHYVNILIVILIPPVFLIIAVYYTKYPKWFKFRHIVYLSIVPAIITILVITSPFHQIIFYDFKIIEQYVIPMHFYKMGYGYYLFDAFIYITMIISLSILIKSVANKDVYFRKQMFLFIIGGFIPFAYDVLFTFGISPLPNYNLACVFISIGNVFFAWSLFGYRFFKLVPITRNMVVEKMPDLMIVTNHENLIIDMNESGKTFFNMKKEKATGISFFEVFKYYPNLVSRYFAKDTAYSEITLEKEGHVFYFSTSITKVEGGGNLLANIIILHNISERIKSELEIKQLSIAVEQSPVSIFTTDLEGNIEYLNHAFCKTTGYSINESIGQHTRLLKGKTNHEVYENLWKTLLNGQIWKGEFINKKKNGEYYYTSTTIAPIKNDKNKSIKYIAIMEDISARKQAEIKIKNQNEQLKELNATKDKFFSIIAHDLKNPFNSILGLSYLLINHFDSYDIDKIKQIIGHIDSTANQTYKLLENLLEWSKLQQGKLLPYLQTINLFDLIKEIDYLHSGLAKNKSISIEYKIKPDTIVFCDKEMTKTVLRNLISNAIKFTPKNGKIKILAVPSKLHYTIQVEDTGIGISVNNIDLIFKLDKNITSPGTENEKGSGLGLLLCKEMVEKQGGEIWVSSEPNKGTSMYFTLKKIKNSDT